MARAVVFTGAGQPLELVRFATPAPRGAEILVRITYCTLCRSDLHTHAGRRIEATPSVLGHEIIGRIEAFGPEASLLDASGLPAAVGSRVTWAVAVGCGHCFYCADELPQKCERPYKYGHNSTPIDRPSGGGLADYILLKPGTAWYRIPDGLSDRVAAPANCATATVAALMHRAGPIAGRNILILGAGVLGATACAMARSSRARTILASDTVRVNRERAICFGATCAVEPAELASAVAEAGAGRGADVVLELAGSAQSAESAIALTRTGGTVILAGTVAPVGKIAFDPEQAVRRMLTIRGVHNYQPIDLETAIAFLADPGREFPFESLIEAEFPLEEAEQAFTRAQSTPGIRVALIP